MNNNICQNCGGIMETGHTADEEQSNICEKCLIDSFQAEVINRTEPAEISATLPATAPGETKAIDSIFSEPAITIEELYLPDENEICPTLIENQPAKTVAEDVIAIDAKDRDDGIAETWEVGDTIAGLYKVTAILGEGAMGRVYKIVHLEWNEALAVKSPKASELKRMGGIENFELEAQTWVRLPLHPNVVSCYYVRRLGKIPRLFAEFVDGKSLSDLIKNRELTDPLKIVDIAIQFAWGLSFAHKNGLVHQDIKPANVMVSTDGRVKVTDFGLARVLQKSHAGDNDNSVAFGGMTPAYCSPEQSAKERLTFKTDIYSFAVSILEIFTGGVSWMTGIAVGELLDNIMNNQDLPENYIPIPPSLADLLMTALAANPDDRPADMETITKKLLEIYKELSGEEYPKEEPKTGRESADNLCNTALSLLDLGRKKEAIDRFAMAIRAEPDHVKGLYNLGLLRWREGGITDADLVKSLGRSLRNREYAEEALYALALVNLERGDTKSAQRDLAKLEEENYQQADITEPLQISRSDESFKIARQKVFEAGSFPVGNIALAGDRLYTAGDDGSVLVYDIKSGKTIFSKQIETGSAGVITCHNVTGRFFVGGCGTALVIGADGKSREMDNGIVEGWIRTCLFSEDGKSLSIVDDSGFYKKINIKTSESENIFKAEGYNHVISGDGRTMALISKEGSPILIDTDNGSLLQKMESFPGTLAIDKTGSTVAVGDKNGKVNIFEFGSEGQVGSLAGHTAPVTSISFSGDGRFVVTTGLDRTIRIWDLSCTVCMRTIEELVAMPLSIAIAEDGCRFAVSFDNGSTELFLTKNIKKRYRAPVAISRVRESEAHSSLVKSFEEKIATAREMMVNGEYEKAVQTVRSARKMQGFGKAIDGMKLWYALYGKCRGGSITGAWPVAEKKLRTGSILSIAVGHGAGTIVTGSSHREAEAVDNKNLETTIYKLEEHEERINSVVISPDESVIATAGADGLIKTYSNLPDGKPVVSGDGKTPITSMDISCDGEIVATGGEDICVDLWHVRSGRKLITLKGHGGNINSVSFSSDARYLISASDDSTVRVWELDNVTSIRVLHPGRGKPVQAKIMDNNKTAVMITDDGSISIWEIPGATEVSNIAGKTATTKYLDFDISPDNNFLVACDDDGGIAFIDVAGAKEILYLKGHAGAVLSCVFSADGTSVITGGDDGRIIVWSLDRELIEGEKDKHPQVTEKIETAVDLYLSRLMKRGGDISKEREAFEEEALTFLTRVDEQVEARQIAGSTDFDLFLQGKGVWYAGVEQITDMAVKKGKNWSGTRRVIPLIDAGDVIKSEEIEGERITPTSAFKTGMPRKY